MPLGSIVMSAAVVAMFLVFAVAVAWGDYQTRPERLNPPSQKH